MHLTAIPVPMKRTNQAASQVKAMRRCAGMVSLRHQNHSVIGNHHGFMQRSIVGVHTLNAESVRRLQALALGLLEAGDT
jgi:hypothetical protein